MTLRPLTTSLTHHRQNFLKRLWPVLKWGMFLAVLILVARHGHKLWTEVDRHSTEAGWGWLARLSWGWLALAVVSSVAAWLPSAWYWKKLMATCGATPPWPQVLRSYYCGHLGKYFPGKAAAIVIRAALLKEAGVSATTAALTVTAESVTYMGAGALLVLMLYSWLAPHLPEGVAVAVANPLVRLGLVAAVLCGGLVGLAVLIRIYRRLLAASVGTPQNATPPNAGSPLRTGLTGILVFLVAWWIQGLTLGLTIRAVTSEPVAWSNWPFWTGTAAVALVGGFVAVFTPGGLGVREGLLMELLTRQLGAHEAVLVAILSRGVALAGEILIASALYYGVSDGATATNSQH